MANMRKTDKDKETSGMQRHKKLILYVSYKVQLILMLADEE